MFNLPPTHMFPVMFTVMPAQGLQRGKSHLHVCAHTSASNLKKHQCSISLCKAGQRRRSLQLDAVQLACIQAQQAEHRGSDLGQGTFCFFV